MGHRKHDSSFRQRFPVQHFIFFGEPEAVFPGFAPGVELRKVIGQKLRKMGQ